MTRPTDAEIAALLRELANSTRTYAQELEDTGYEYLAYESYNLESRARAMANQLQPEDQA